MSSKIFAISQVTLQYFSGRLFVFRELLFPGQPSLVLIRWHTFDSGRRGRFPFNLLIGFPYPPGDVALCRLDFFSCLVTIFEIDT